MLSMRFIAVGQWVKDLMCLQLSFAVFLLQMFSAGWDNNSFKETWDF